MSIRDRDEALEHEHRLRRRVKTANARARQNLSAKLEPPETVCEVCLERSCVCINDVGGTD